MTDTFAAAGMFYFNKHTQKINVTQFEYGWQVTLHTWKKTTWCTTKIWFAPDLFKAGEIVSDFIAMDNIMEEFIPEEACNA